LLKRHGQALPGIGRRCSYRFTVEDSEDKSIVWQGLIAQAFRVHSTLDIKGRAWDGQPFSADKFER